MPPEPLSSMEPLTQGNPLAPPEAEPADGAERRAAPSVPFVCGINHERAELALRERFALAESACRATLRRLREEGLAEEALVLSTCNRTEIYAIGERDAAFNARLRAFFLSLAPAGWSPPHPPPLYDYDALEAARHVFAVAAGLNSMILGENEIKHQLRQALEVSRQEAMGGPHLQRLVAAAFRCAKRIRAETGLNVGTLDFGRAAARRAEEALGTLAGKCCLVIGAGEVGRSAAQALAQRGPRRLVILNRSRPRAEEVAEGLAAEIGSIGDMIALLPDADLIVGAAFAPNFLVTKEMFARARGRTDRPICLVDAAVPRILDQAIRTLSGVALFDLGDLESIIAENRARRTLAAQRAWEIVEEEVEKFGARWERARLSPAIARLKRRFEAVFAAEAESAAPAAEADRRKLRRALNRLRQRLLHEAIEELRDSHGALPRRRRDGRGADHRSPRTSAEAAGERPEAGAREPEASGGPER